jgi:hypothetical protein
MMGAAATNLPQCGSELYFRVRRKDIAFVKFIIEAYEGIGSLTTIQPSDGLIRIQIPPGCKGVVQDVIEDLRRDLRIQPVEKPGD